MHDLVASERLAREILELSASNRSAPATRVGRRKLCLKATRPNKCVAIAPYRSGLDERLPASNPMSIRAWRLPRTGRNQLDSTTCSKGAGLGLGGIGPDETFRSVMPATLRCRSSDLLERGAALTTALDERPHEHDQGRLVGEAGGRPCDFGPALRLGPGVGTPGCNRRQAFHRGRGQATCRGTDSRMAEPLRPSFSAARSLNPGRVKLSGNLLISSVIEAWARPFRTYGSISRRESSSGRVVRLRRDTSILTSRSWRPRVCAFGSGSRIGCAPGLEASPTTWTHSTPELTAVGAGRP
jgi:hypothetical protein